MDSENILAIGLVIILSIILIFMGIELYSNVFKTDSVTTNNNQVENYCPYCGHRLDK